MGGQQSSRRVSFENDEQPSGNVVKVSEKVVVELLKQTKNDNPIQQKNIIKTVNEDKVSIDKLTPRAMPTNEPPPPLIAGRNRRELEQQYTNDIAKDNEYWESRILALQESHDRINKTWEKEYKRALDDVDRLFGKVPPKDKKPPCGAEKTAVLNCYKKNSKQPLICASEVQKFVDCINNAGKK